MFKVEALTTAQLVSIGTPQVAGEPSASPGVLYDVQTWLAAGVPQGLQFFQDSGNQRWKSNINGGRLPKGFNFLIQAICLTPLAKPTFTANTQTGVIDDIEKFLKSNQTVAVYEKNQKPLFPIPTTFLHASGGATGFMAASYTAPQVMQYGNNGVFDGGFTTDGSLVILDQEPFNFTIYGIQPAVALTADLPLRVEFRGVWYMPVR